jgi:hypothetical protein
MNNTGVVIANDFKLERIPVIFKKINLIIGS